MLDIILSVQGAIAGRAESLVRRGAWAWRSALLAVVLIGACGAALEEAAQGEAAQGEAAQGEAAQGEAAQGEAAQGEAARGEHEPGPPAAIDGFRQARFGMAEEQVRQAIRKDFPAAAGKVASAIHPSEKTTVLTVTVPDLLPHSGNARISYILGHRSKKLGQVNIVWSSDGSTAGDEAIVGTANSLRDYFSLEHFKPDSIVANHQLAPNAILVFRASDEQNRTVLLVLSGAAAGARAEDKKAPKPPPLTLELSYIEDPAHPDVFRIGKGQF